MICFVIYNCTPYFNHKIESYILRQLIVTAPKVLPNGKELCIYYENDITKNQVFVSLEYLFRMNEAKCCGEKIIEKVLRIYGFNIEYVVDIYFTSLCGTCEKLDYCISLIFGHSSCSLNKLILGKFNGDRYLSLPLLDL